MNYLYIPVIFFFYPETAGRSLEEIDIIFAKAYEDGTQPWRVANHLPKLSLQEVEDHANALGSYDDEMEKEDFCEDRVEDTYNQINGDNSSSSSNIKNEDTVNDKANFEG